MNVIKIIESSSGMPTPHDGRYLASYNPDTEYGTLEMATTDDLSQAMRFVDANAVFRFWMSVSELQPVRPDGKPNRPITFLSVEIIWVD